MRKHHHVWNRSLDQIPNFENSRWRTAAILKMVLSLRFGRGSSASMKFDADANFNTNKTRHITKFKILQIITTLAQWAKIMNGDISLEARWQRQSAAEVISPFIIFAVFDVSFRSYKLYINYSFFTFILVIWPELERDSALSYKISRFRWDIAKRRFSIWRPSAILDLLWRRHIASRYSILYS